LRLSDVIDWIDLPRYGIAEPFINGLCFREFMRVFVVAGSLEAGIEM